MERVDMKSCAMRVQSARWDVLFRNACMGVSHDVYKPKLYVSVRLHSVHVPLLECGSRCNRGV